MIEPFQISEIYELFFVTPGMPFFEKKDILNNAIKEGTKKGFFGVKNGTEIFYKRDVAIDDDFIILRGELAKELKEMSKENGIEKYRKGSRF